MKYIVVFNVKFPIFYPTATKFEFSLQIYIKSQISNITENRPLETCGQKDGMKKLTVAFVHVRTQLKTSN